MIQLILLVLVLYLQGVKSQTMSCTILAENNVVMDNKGSFKLTFTTLKAATPLTTTLTWSSTWSSDSKRAIRSTTTGSVTACTMTIGNAAAINCNTLTSDTVTCNNPSGTTNAGTNVVVACTNILNPTSVAPAGNFQLQTRESGTVVDQCPTNMQITNFVAATTPSSLASFQITQSSVRVTPNQSGVGQVDYNQKTPLYGTDQITLDFQVCKMIGTVNPVLMVQGDINSSTKSFQPSNIISQTQTSITLQQSSASDLSFAPAVTVILSQMVAGPSTQPCIVSISVRRLVSSQRYLTEQLLNTVSFTPTSGSLSLANTLDLSTPVINQISSYTMQITLSNPVKKTGYFHVLMPTGVVPTAPVTCRMTVGTSTKTGTCSIDSPNSLQRVIVKDILENDVTDTTQPLILTISNVRNAARTDATIQFSQVQSYYASDATHLVDELKSGVSYSSLFKQGQLQSVSVSSINAEVAEVSTLRLKFTPSNPIPSNGILLLTIPSDIAFTQQPTSCTLGAQTGISCKVTYQSNSVAQISGFTNADITTAAVLDIANFIRNPYSTRPTGTFSLQSYHSSNGQLGAIIDERLSFAGFSVSDPSEISSVRLTSQGSLKNGEATSYTFSVTLSTPIPNESFLFIEFTDLDVSDNVKCAGDDVILQPTLQCVQPSNDVVRVTLTCKSCSSIISTSQSFSVTVQPVTNYFSFAPTSPMKFYIRDATFKVAEYSQTNVFTTNKVAGAITAPELSLKNGVYGEPDTYRLTFTTTERLPTDGFILVQVPTWVSIGPNVECGNNFLGFATSPTCQVTGRQITVKGTPTGSLKFGVELTGLTNPNVPPPATSFQVLTYHVKSGQNYLIDQSNTNALIFTPKCDLPCRSCSLQDKSQCTTCFDNAAVTASKYYLSEKLTCVAGCGDGYFQDETALACKKCQTNCKVCDKELKCTVCLTNYRLSENTCVSACEPGRYPSGENCLKCDQNCLTCDGAAVLCTSCSVKMILHEKQCLSECPVGLFLKDGKCVGCSSPCLTCVNSPQECTSCDPNSNAKLLQGKSCLAECQSGYYSNISQGKCLPCESPCDACKSQTACTTCLPPYLKLEEQCLKECPLLYYADGLKCEKCNEGCVECNQTECLKCAPSFFRLGNSCYDTCPDGYKAVPDESTCVEAPPPVEDPVVVTPTSLGENEYIPVPFLILYFIVSLTVIVAKIHKFETYVPGAVIGLGGGLEWASWITVLYLYYAKEGGDFGAAVILGLVLNYVINVVNIVVSKGRIYPDPEFQKWYSATVPHKVSSIVIYTLSLLINFKISRIIYSKYFAFNFFKAKLSSIEPLSAFNVLNGVSILLTTLPICVGSALMAYHNPLRDQLFISSIDCFIVTVLTAVFQIWETKKDENFFEEPSAQQYYSLNVTKLEKGEDSGFFNNTFPKSLNLNQNDQTNANQDQDPESVQQAGGQDESKILPSQSPKVIYSDRHSQGYKESARGKFNDQDQQQHTAPKSNSKHTIYFGTQYKRDDVALSTNSRLQQQQQRNESPEPPPQRIVEHTNEVDPDEEPVQPIARTIEQPPQQKLSSRQQTQQQQQQSISPRPPSITPPKLKSIGENKSTIVQAAQKPVVQQRQSSQGDEDSKLSIFDDDNQALNQVPEKKNGKRKNSFDNVLNLKQGQSSLAAKLLVHGHLNTEENQPDKVSIPVSHQQQNSIQNNSIQNNSQFLKNNSSLQNNSQLNGQSIQQHSLKNNPQQLQNLSSIQNNSQLLQQQQRLQNNSLLNQQATSQPNMINDTTIQPHTTPYNTQPTISPRQVEQLEIKVENMDASMFKPQVVPAVQENNKKGTKQPQQPSFKKKETKTPEQGVQRGRSQNAPGKFRKSNSPNEMKKSVSPPLSQNNRVVKQQQVNDDKLKQMLDSNDSVRTLSDANWGENQISPSDFNVLNQRYDDDDHIVEDNNSKPAATAAKRNKTLEQPKAVKVPPIRKNNHHSPDPFSENDNRLQSVPYRTASPPRIVDHQFDESQIRQLEQGRLKDIEKIYLQRIENTTGGNRNSNKKKTDRNRQKDISDAFFIDDQFDEDDIIF